LFDLLSIIYKFPLVNLQKQMIRCFLDRDTERV